MKNVDLKASCKTHRRKNGQHIFDEINTMGTQNVFAKYCPTA